MFGFGKKIEVEVPDGRGGRKTIWVSEKEMNRLKAAGQEIEGFKVHILDPMNGVLEQIWEIDKDMPREQYDAYKDEHGEVFVVIHYRQGEENMNAVSKQIWEDLKKEAFE